VKITHTKHKQKLQERCERSNEFAKRGEMKVRYEANEVQTKPLPLQEQLGGMMGEKRNIATSWCGGHGRTFCGGTGVVSI